MALTVNKPYVVLRTGELDEKLVLHPSIGFCDGIVIDKPYIGLSASIHDNKPVYLVGNQTLETDGTLTVDKPYIGLQASSRDDKLVFLVDGKDCGEGEVVILCDCTIPCTINATIKVQATGFPFVWSDPVDTPLTCGGAIIVTCTQSCCTDPEDPDTCTYTDYEQSYTGGTGTYIGSGGTEYSYVTEVWSSETFVLEGRTFRAFLVVTEFTYPDEVTTVCSYYSGVMEQVDGSWSVNGYQFPGPAIAPLGFPAPVILASIDVAPGCGEGETQGVSCGSLLGLPVCVSTSPPSSITVPGCDPVFDWHWSSIHGTDPTQTKCLDFHVFDDS